MSDNRMNGEVPDKLAIGEGPDPEDLPKLDDAPIADLPPADEPERKGPGQPPIDLQAIVERQVVQTMGILIRGFLISSPGVPQDMLLKAIAKSAGQMLAMSVSGGQNTVDMVVRARKDFKESFDEGIKKIPLLDVSSALAGAGLKTMPKKFGPGAG